MSNTITPVTTTVVAPTLSCSDARHVSSNQRAPRDTPRPARSVTARSGASADVAGSAATTHHGGPAL